MNDNEMLTDLATLDQTNLPPLTPKQMAFVRGLAIGLDDNKAYSQAYDTTNWAINSIYAQANKMRNHPKIILWVKAMQRAGQETARCTIEAHLAELGRIKDLAVDVNQLSVAARCEELRGKVTGHYVTRVAVTMGDDEAFCRLLDAMNGHPSDTAKVIEHEPGDQSEAVH